ncbi:hypothetical protein [Gimesia chilikensis]|uniref:Uncharacterized protein n=1 Tax=Gimesia chilikensis TaxID=2605989 RepID=A0A517PUM4_9PLAN|nr:hypothetical protein [Gimesia chilikensis]QDT23081.1 hypothetical protein HG66A1_48940 [Gimesia chilikensis]
MHEKVDNRHKKILSTLFKANGKLDSFTLFKRARFSFAEFTNLIRFLKKHEYLREEEYVFFLTSKGKKSSLVSHEAEGKKRKWREVPANMLGNKIEISEGYVPSKSMLDQEF